MAVESSQNIDPQKDSISFDDFQRMDIRVSTILAAEKVAKTKKLLKLTVDTGIDRREIVSASPNIIRPRSWSVGRCWCSSISNPVRSKESSRAV